MSALRQPVMTATSASTHRRPWTWVGPVGVGLLFVAAIIPFVTAPNASDADAATTVSSFYAESGNRTALAVAEPIALFGAFLALWFAAALREFLRQSGGDDRRATVAFAGMASFAVLALVSVLVHTSPAGLLSFSSGFELDPHTAMLFHHLGYVLLVAGLMSGAAAALATGSVVRHTGVLPHRTGIASTVVGVLALVALPFVYLPLTVFTVWVAIVSARIPRALGEV